MSPKRYTTSSDIKMSRGIKSYNRTKIMMNEIKITSSDDTTDEEEMKRRKNNRRAFYVIQFIELPFEGIDDYVCVPYTWLVVRRPSDHKAAVAYPKDEDPFDTRDRVKRKGRYDDEWRLYMAAVKYESDTYKDAEYWIATRNDYGPLVEKESTISDTPSRFRLNNKLRNGNKSNSSQFKMCDLMQQIITITNDTLPTNQITNLLLITYQTH